MQCTHFTDDEKTECQRGKVQPGTLQRLSLCVQPLGDQASLFQSSLDSSSSYDSEMPSSQEMSSVASRASCPQDAHPDDPCGRYWPGEASSGMNSLPIAKCLHRESLGPPRPHSAPLLVISDSSDPELSAELDSPGTQEAQALRSILARQGKLSKVMWESGAAIDGASLNLSFPFDRCTHRQPPFQGERLLGGAVSHVLLSLSA